MLKSINHGDRYLIEMEVRANVAGSYLLKPVYALASSNGTWMPAAVLRRCERTSRALLVGDRVKWDTFEGQIEFIPEPDLENTIQVLVRDENRRVHLVLLDKLTLIGSDVA